MTAHILIVDDDKLLSGSLQMAFEAKEYKVTIASNGVEGLEIMKKENPDVILLDIMMPGKTGVEIIKELYNEKSNLLGKIIIMTTLSDASLLAEVLERGVKTYIEKSDTNPKGILDAVDRALGK